VGSHREQRAAVLGSATLPGRPEEVSRARAFIRRVLSRLPGVDSDAATLLTSELVTNAIQHTRSGAPGGTVTVVVLALHSGVLIEVTDAGSPGTPIVKGDLYAAEGHGLYLVQRLAAQWGYLRDATGTTVWFHLRGGEPVNLAPLDAGSVQAKAPKPRSPAEESSSVGPVPKLIATRLVTVAQRDRLSRH